MEVNEAADLLDNLVGMVEDSNEADYDTALRMGIEALRASGDIIYRQAAIDAIRTKYCPSDFMDDGVIDAFAEIIQDLPSTQLETRTFVELVVEYPDQELCTYKEFKGKPYYSIKYIENGETYVGYGTYKPEVLSRYLRECFMPSAQPEPQWIPVKMRPMDSEEREYWEDQFGEKLEDEDAVMFDCPMPEDGQEILVSYRKWISMDKCEIDGGCYGLEGNGDWEDVIAWMPLPEPYKEKDNERA